MNNSAVASDLDPDQDCDFLRFTDQDPDSILDDNQ